MRGVDLERPLEPLAGRGLIALIERAVTQFARDLRTLGSVTPLLTVRQPQLDDLGGRLGTATEAAEDGGRAIEAAELLVGECGVDQRLRCEVAAPGSELVLRTLEQVLDLRHTFQQAFGAHRDERRRRAGARHGRHRDRRHVVRQLRLDFVHRGLVARLILDLDRIDTRGLGDFVVIHRLILRHQHRRRRGDHRRRRDPRRGHLGDRSDLARLRNGRRRERLDGCARWPETGGTLELARRSAGGRLRVCTRIRIGRTRGRHGGIRCTRSNEAQGPLELE